MQIKLNEKKIEKLVSGEDDLSQQLKKIFNSTQQEVVSLNKNLGIDLNLFREDKKLLMKSLLNKKEIFLKDKYTEKEKNRIKIFFNELILPIRSCSPPVNTENENQKQENIEKEKQFFTQQEQLQEDKLFLESLKQLAEKGKKYKDVVKIYIVYAWPDENNIYYEREKAINTFINNLHEHLTLAGIKPFKDTLDNFVGSNLNEQMGKLLDSDYVLLLGTETFREKLLSEKETALTFEQILLNLKWLDDLKKGNINKSKTTIIPYVLTGTRHTAFPDEWGHLQYQNLTIRSFGDYTNTLFTIIDDVYGCKITQELQNSKNNNKEKILINQEKENFNSSSLKRKNDDNFFYKNKKQKPENDEKTNQEKSKQKNNIEKNLSLNHYFKCYDYICKKEDEDWIIEYRITNYGYPLTILYGRSGTGKTQIVNTIYEAVSERIFKHVMYILNVEHNNDVTVIESILNSHIKKINNIENDEEDNVYENFRKNKENVLVIIDDIIFKENILTLLNQLSKYKAFFIITSQEEWPCFKSDMKKIKGFSKENIKEYLTSVMDKRGNLILFYEFLQKAF